MGQEEEGIEIRLVQRLWCDGLICDKNESFLVPLQKRSTDIGSVIRYNDVGEYLQKSLLSFSSQFKATGNQHD